MNPLVLSKHRWALVFVGVVILALMLFSASQVVRSQNNFLDTDFFSFWLAGNMILEGEDPYSEEQWIEGHVVAETDWISDPTFLYPLPLAIMFAPLGLFQFRIVAMIWVFISEVWVILSAALLISLWQTKRKRHYVFPVLAGIFLFRPVLVTLHNGQLGALFLLILSLIIYFWERDQWVAGGMLLPLLALKPNIGLLLVVLVCFWLIVCKRISALKAGGLVTLGILSIGWVRDPDWIQKYITIGNLKLSNTFGHTPTLWGATASLCEYWMSCTIGMGTLLSVLLIAACVFLIIQPWNHVTPSVVVAVIIPVVLLVTPYLWAYDHILLVIPIIVAVGKMIRNGFSYMVTATLFLIMSIMALMLLFLATKVGNDVWSVLVPFVSLLLIGWQSLTFRK